MLTAFSTTRRARNISYKFACSHRSGLEPLRKVAANISLCKMLRRPLLQRAGVLHS